MLCYIYMRLNRFNSQNIIFWRYDYKWKSNFNYSNSNFFKIRPHVGVNSQPPPGTSGPGIIVVHIAMGMSESSGASSKHQAHTLDGRSAFSVCNFD